MQMEANEVLAIASVPCQKWGQPYQADEALAHGTIFPALCKPFYITEGALEQTDPIGTCCKDADSAQQEREQLLNRIYQVSFFLNDLTLYLDTHTEDAQALKEYAEKGKERITLLDEFAKKYYPLTCDCVAKCSGGAPENLWAKGPMPWEGACV